jgi:starch synthase
LLRHRREVLSGILNGIDTRVWDPASDALIAQRYDADDARAQGREQGCAAAAPGTRTARRGAARRHRSRLTHQKGVDLLAAAADALAALPAQLQ